MITETKIKFKYKYITCQRCKADNNEPCQFWLCPYISEALVNLADNEIFLAAVQHAECYETLHKNTLIFLKKFSSDASARTRNTNETEENDGNPVCETVPSLTFKPECHNCGYSSPGFMCYSIRDGTCLRDWKNGKYRHNS